MANYWTVEQAQANAELLAKEFSNRQILIFGLGEPSFNVPIGVEYEDRSFKPAIRYRKIGAEANEWKRLYQVEPATEAEVLIGVDEQKMVTSARLTEKLNQFGSELLGIPNQIVNSDSNLFVLQLTPINQSTFFKLILPNTINISIASIQVRDHLAGETISTIEGGEVGQIISIRRYSNHSLGLVGSDLLKLSAPMTLDDTQLLDNITLQKIDSVIWVELARIKFTE